MAYPNPENMTGVWDMFQYAHSVSEGILGPGLAISLYCIVFLFLKLKGNETSDSFVVAGFLTSIFSVFLFLGGIMSDQYLFIAFIGCAVPIAWSYFSKGE